MKKRFRLAAAGSAVLIAAAQNTAVPAVHAAYGVGGNGTAIMEYLDRGIYAVKSGNGMFVSWRWNADDADDAEFRLYRDGTLIYTSKSGNATSYQDNGGNANSRYRVDTVANGTVVSSEECRFTSGTNYFDIALKSPGSQYSPNDCCVGDADGDGQYEIFLKWDPANAKDNSQDGKTDNVYIDCYTLTGKQLWRIDMGVNIRAGQHYTQMCVADFDCDGKAELITKTADGTKDGKGKVIGDGSKNYVNGAGRILDGPEYLTLFDGLTGAALDTIDFPVPRGKVTKATWGDDYGNRVDRFNSGIAYLDGVHPSAIYGRGYYTRLTVSAVDVRGGKLVKRWVYDTGFDKKTPGWGCGNHNLMAADSDNDGKQEIFMGASAIDDNGKLLWTTGQLHGDAMHLGDLIPDRPGLELWECHEDNPWGESCIDAKTGEVIFHINNTKDTGRCAADNIWSGNKGAEFWGAADGNVYDKSGKKIGGTRPAQNFFIYWDGDLEREILDGTNISKMTAADKIDRIFTATGCASNNSTKSVPCMTADLFGDWREELIMRTDDNQKIRIWCTAAETKVRLTTLMHDMQYRAQNCCQQSAYNQPPHVSYYLGSDAPLPERPNVIVNGKSTAQPAEPVNGKYITKLNVGDTANAASWSIVTEPKQQGSEVFGDRTFRFTSVPAVLEGAEWIQTACDSKKYNGEEASFTAGADITAFVALDTRVTDVPAWLGGWDKTADTLTDDGDPVVTYQLYRKNYSAGEIVTLGALAQTSCVNYTVAATAQKAESPVIGDINRDGARNQTDLVMMRDYLLTVGTLTPEQGAAADLNQDGKITADDLTLLKRLLLA
ncbi:MAG: hypothetical protein IJ060_10005 [Oscillospiraceae bacterium]|nr:hypothetical protein [Oscillospiraceae bacterium]